MTNLKSSENKKTGLIVRAALFSILSNGNMR
jgi:hypothetical protein